LNHSAKPEKMCAGAETDCLQRKLVEAEERLKQVHDAFLEARADLAYVRHRGQADIAHAHKYAIEGFAQALLAVKDNLETALRVETNDQDAFKVGITLISKQLIAAFEAFELYEICPNIGDPFDSSRHRSAARISSDRPQNTVVEVRMKGYRIGDRLLRPALVSVSQPDVNDAQ
jgi:molecular chaperone GrpE